MKIISRLLYTLTVNVFSPVGSTVGNFAVRSFSGVQLLQLSSLGLSIEPRRSGSCTCTVLESDFVCCSQILPGDQIP